ncbi:MAG: ferritin-like domain-containing protein [Proteobacteria bacterium]|nr:ferritin-like domain-containing protein [Pseudomonadota bacterium]
MGDLHAAAKAVLDCDDIVGKPAAARALAAAFHRGELVADETSAPPQAIAMPGRPATPKLVHPRDLPRRGFGSNEGRAAFIHAVAHIEFNAIDLACDAIYRFRGMPAEYYADWVMVADDEARHFLMLRERLQAFAHDYGDFDAHNGLWEMAEKTAHDGLARMALVPRVLEARGLDVTPGMIVKLRALGDDETAGILEIILREEIAHVAAGSRWYRWHCERAGVEPRSRFRELLKEYASGVLHKPFNIEARTQAGFDAEELESLLAAAD